VAVTLVSCVAQLAVALGEAYRMTCSE